MKKKIFEIVGEDFSKGIRSSIKTQTDAIGGDNVYTFWRSYYYALGCTEERFAEKLKEKLIEGGLTAEVLDYGNHRHSFVGSAKCGSAQDSFFWAVIKVEVK